MIKIRNKIEDLYSKIYSRLIKGSFKEFGRSHVMPSARIDNSKHITIKDGVYIGRNVWLYAMIGDSSGKTYNPQIIIEQGTQIYDNCHITCATSLKIGKQVLITRNVLITDSVHNYEDPKIAVINQGLRNKVMQIGDHCWIGNNAVIIGCKIGKHCVIGANTFVNTDIPDYSIVAGIPGKIIKKFDAINNKWIRQE